MKHFLKSILNFSIYILVVLVLTLLVVRYVGQRTVVMGHSMEPTLSDQDNLLVDKLSYRLHDPKRFDVVVFPYQYADKTYFIKRIIGLPGETVRIDDTGSIYINDELLMEAYGKEVIEDPGLARDGITLGADEYFVLGDNRNDSSDSRFVSVGNIKGSQIIGKAFLRIYPFSAFGRIR
ncbi:MAG: signal peptidase I [Lachnospiraceae bacterium]|nr:signal peptidase I [Lachnospiraceae bacterium]MDD5854430.1 signal peptidase I [Lachnospiraceae bacterium]